MLAIYLLVSTAAEVAASLPHWTETQFFLAFCLVLFSFVVVALATQIILNVIRRVK